MEHDGSSKHLQIFWFQQLNNKMLWLKELQQTGAVSQGNNLPGSRGFFSSVVSEIDFSWIRFEDLSLKDVKYSVLITCLFNLYMKFH